MFMVVLLAGRWLLGPSAVPGPLEGCDGQARIAAWGFSCSPLFSSALGADREAPRCERIRLMGRS